MRVTSYAHQVAVAHFFYFYTADVKVREELGIMSGLKLYEDALSPVCRSVMLFLSMNSIPHELVHISLKDHETRTNPELFAINPNRRVPAINDNGFTMFESCAILRYLVQKYNVPEHWYPKDLQTRARVDEALAWFPGNLRCGAFFHSAILPKRTGQPRNEEKVAELTAILKKSLEVIDTYFLKDKKFIGGEQVSIADLEFLGEITQYWIAGLDIYKGRPNIERWMEDCQKVLAPHFDKLYQFIYDMRKAGTFATTLDL